MDINELLRSMMNKGASDLHLKASAHPVLRVDGTLDALVDQPLLTAEDVAQALRTIADSEQYERFQRNLELDFAYGLPGVARFRVNAAFQRGSVALSFRLVPFDIPKLESLALPDACRSLAMQGQGFVVVTGPTGSGKSTTLAAMIDYINCHARRRIVTIEDPIEFLYGDNLSFVTQREVGSDTRDFASALRAALRQDPDVILVGEMRDVETISTAITAAETGHLVLGTLHTIGAAQTVDRITNAFPSSQQLEIRMELSLCLEGVISQTLLPRLGDRGRVAVAEVMVAVPAVRNLIREGKTYQLANVIATGAHSGMRTLDQDLYEHVVSNQVALEEALLRAGNPEELRRRLAVEQPAGLLEDGAAVPVNRLRSHRA